ncbi:MAG TPA: MFS transporter [Candidatus Limnocylindrales bacterium]|nr:MFS transporter [Candidatus Limnocylindrales bacterium]
MMTGKRLVFTIGFGVIFTDMVSYGIISPSIPLFAKALAASDAQMGYAFAGYPIAFTLAVIPLGLFVDRVGKNWLIISIAMFVLAGASALMAFADSITILITARALQGLASAAAWVATQPLIARGAGVDEADSREMSVVTIAAGVGVIVGPLLGGIGNLETPFLINAVMAFGWGVAALLFLTREGTAASGARPAMWELLKRRGLRIACLAIFCSCACFGIMELLLPLRLDRLGYDKLWIGLVFGVFSVVYVASQPVITKWIDRRGGYEPIYMGSFGLAVMMVLVVQAAGFVTLSAMMSLAGVFSGTLFLASMFVVTQNSQEGQRGSAFALWNLAFSLGYLVGPAVGGNLSSQLGLPVAFYCFAAFLLAGAAWIYVTTRRARSAST